MAAVLAAVLAALASPVATVPSDGVVAAKLVAGRLSFFAAAKDDASEPWVRVSTPIPYRGQTPLGIVVRSEPPGRVRSLAVEAEGEDRLVRVALAPMKAGERVKLVAETIALLRMGGPPDGRGVALAKPAELTEEMRAYLSPAPGVDSGDPRIVEIAAKFSRKDLHAVVNDTLGWLRENVAGGSGPQGALDVLERKSAACTGHANLGAALLIAAGVPTRILPCILVGMDQQEHYIVEAWTPKLGWSKVETTTKTFPLGDSVHLVLRFAGPKTPRSSGSVPLYHPVGGPEGAGVSADYEKNEKHCFQSAEILETLELRDGEAEAIETAARKAFEALREKPAKGGSILLVPKNLPREVKARGRKLVEDVEKKLAAEPATPASR